MKMIAFYLPQYYTFKENDLWWGKGFTEWTNVKKAKPLYKGHYQPTVPLNHNYYSLEDINTMKWQVDLAKKYGVYGFCFYHYWFGEGRQLMEKPVDAFLNHREIDFPYCLSWANHTWSRTWAGEDKDILMDMRYGSNDEWEKHFLYLLPFFKDKRYIQIDEKPILVIYLPQHVENLSAMLGYWNDRVQEEGLKGITYISQSLFEYDNTPELNKLLDYNILYEPNASRLVAEKQLTRTMRVSKCFALDIIKYRLKRKINKISFYKLFKYRTLNYDCNWNYILNRFINSEKIIAGAFVNCDFTPRRQERALIYKGATPEKFENYLATLADKVSKGTNPDIIFISAWNEWGEGMYLEPDEKHKYRYLEAVKKVVDRYPEDNEN